MNLVFYGNKIAYQPSVFDIIPELGLIFFVSTTVLSIFAKQFFNNYIPFRSCTIGLVGASIADGGVESFAPEIHYCTV